MDTSTFLSKFVCVCLVMLCACGRTNTAQPYAKYRHYRVEKKVDGSVDGRWSDYLHRHLGKRSADKTLVEFAGSSVPKEDLYISVHVDANLPCDYRIERNVNTVTLSASSEDIMLWLIYQFIAGVSLQDSRITADDLPLAVIDPEPIEGNVAFAWRSLYTYGCSNLEVAPIRGTHHVDNDWALWGHGLAKTLGGIKTAYAAEIDGEKNYDQFCFSSQALYDATVEYILDQHGEGDASYGERMMLMPTDNYQACTCAACRRLGNKPDDATPAVVHYLKRVAQRFPHHHFYTVAYGSMKSVPAERLPDNVGVFLSAIDLPLTPAFKKKPQFAPFAKNLNGWKAKAANIYVWDYCNNFDDYLTPFPCLSALRARLLYYKESGVKGVFFNGSGYDYATFDDLHTYVLSALLINPSTEIEPLVRRFFTHYFPKTGKTLADFYLGLEAKAASASRPLLFYGGIGDACRTYLDAEAFEAFWTALDRTSKTVNGPERKRLNDLLVALNFTRLELSRLVGETDNPPLQDKLDVMREYSENPDLKNYREAYGDMKSYMREWGRYRTWRFESNELAGARVTPALVGGDELPTKVLNDGFLGFASDYHTGWVISADPVTTLTFTPAVPLKSRTLEFSFMQAPRWRILPPSLIEVEQNGKVIGRLQYDKAPTAEEAKDALHVPLTVKLSEIATNQPLTLRIQPSKRTVRSRRASWACDEITLK